MCFSRIIPTFILTFKLPFFYLKKKPTIYKQKLVLFIVDKKLVLL